MITCRHFGVVRDHNLSLGEITKAIFLFRGKGQAFEVLISNGLSLRLLVGKGLFNPFKKGSQDVRYRGQSAIMGDKSMDFRF